MSTIQRLYVRALSPNHAFGRSLIRLRMGCQAIPLRLAGDNEEFLDLCDAIVPRYSMVSLDRLESLYHLAIDTARHSIPGAIVECGSWNGGAAAMAAAGAMCGGRTRDVWLYDSFDGLPRPTVQDGLGDVYYKGWCLGSPDLAREILNKVGVPDVRIHIIKGWFEETLPDADVGPIALLHVDSDWYRSVLQTLEAFYDNVVPGGVIIFDDYGRWAGARKAVDEFLRARGVAGGLLPSGRAGRYLVKGDD